MSDRVYPACALGRSTICLGRQLDHEARKILFDVRDWLEKWPGATIAGFAIPPIGEGYPITLDVSDGIAAWTIRNSDTATAGHGMVQLVLLGKNGEKLHSANAATQIGTSAAASAGDTPPDAAKPWFEELLEKIRQLEENGVTDEQIGEALDEYMKEHPIGGVKPEDVEEAVRTALKEAKDSGEFDGKDGETGPQGPAGKDGFSPVITVTNITGGHRVTITDANGTKSFDVLDGTGGSGEGSGAPGQDGFSPIISVIKIEGGHKVTITDATGTSEFDVMDGKNGEDGSAADVIDDTAPSTEKTYSSSKIDELLNAQKEAIDAQGETLTQLNEKIVDDDLPLIFYGKDIPQIKDVEVVMPFDYFGKSGNMRLFCETKAQGTSSMAYPKKNQTTKFYADEACNEKLKVNFRNWGKQNKFCVKANWIDITHARNIVSARIWGDIVRSRANFAELPELLRTSPNVGAIDGFPVLAYVGGVYHGRYTINIPKDGWMANMDDENPNHCILCGENYVSGCFRAPAQIDESDWSDELHEVVPENIRTRWNEVISFVMNSTDEEFKENLDNYFDVISLIDYDIFAIASCGLDSMGKNQIYLTYDGQKWFASMYDMDSTWGLYWDGSKFVDATYSRKNFEDYVSDRKGNLLYIRLEKLFHEEIKTRWDALKAGALSYANIMRRFEEFVGIVPQHIVAEDYAATTGNGEFTGIPSKDTNNIRQIRAFAKARLAYTDGYVTALPSVYVPGADTIIAWSDEPDKQVQSDGTIISGGNYMTNFVPTTGYYTARLRNIAGASYTYLTVYQYDVDMKYLGFVSSYNTTKDVEFALNANAAYVMASAFPNNVGTNNDPAVQIEFILSSSKWSEKPNRKISSFDGTIGDGGNFVTLVATKINGGETVKLENAAGASFNYLGIAQYNSDDEFIKYAESSSPCVVVTEQNAEYVRFSAYPNDAATNNDPENQLVITVS